MGPSSPPRRPGCRPSARYRHHRAPHHGDALADQAGHRPRTAGLAAGRIPLTHQALDELRKGQALAHLRQALVAVGALPARDEEMVRLEAFLAGLLASQPDTERRQLLHRYLIWRLVRRLRRRNNGRPATRQQSLLSAGSPTAPSRSWTGLTPTASPWAAASRPISIAGSPTNRPPTVRKPGGSSAGPAPASSPPATSPPPDGTVPPSCWITSTAGTPRAALARRRYQARDRLAGLLVLLYAQGATAISRMTAGQIRLSATAYVSAWAAFPSSCPSRPPPSPAPSPRTARATRPSEP